MNKIAELKIGELAVATGVTVGTLRYYSNLGLLQPVYRGKNSYRYYSLDAKQQVEFIKKAQVIGFTLEEIKQILAVRDRGEKPCNLVQSLLAKKIEQLENKIQQMILSKAELEEYQRSWQQNSDFSFPSSEICPLISTIALESVPNLSAY